MLKHVKLLLAFAAAAVLLANCATNASASRSIELGAVRETSFASRAFEIVEEGGIFAVSCEVTLLMTLPTAVPKRTGVQFGEITAIGISRETCREPVLGFPASISLLNCRQGIVLCVSNANSWRMFYVSFSGTLPEISGIIVEVETTILFEVPTVIRRCLYAGSMAFKLNVAARRVTGAEALPERTRLVKIMSGLQAGACEAFMTTQGRFGAPAAAVAIRLI